MTNDETGTPVETLEKRISEAILAGSEGTALAPVSMSSADLLVMSKAILVLQQWRQPAPVPARRMKRGCHSCDFSQPVGEGQIVCRRNAPVSLIPREGLLYTQATFPVVKASDWCGAWTEKIAEPEEGEAA